MSKSLVTFALFAYNQEWYIREAVRAALSQTYSPLEIIISDDCSQDRTFEFIEEEVAGYDGPHKIVLNRNEENLGIGGHVNRIMELTSGELIVAAAGDDVSLPSRTEELVSTWTRGGVFSVYSNMIVIDAEGNEKGSFADIAPEPIQSWQEMVRFRRGIFGCTHAWDRAVFDKFGPLPKGVVHEDFTIAFRAALIGTVVYVNKCLVKYRRHSANIWKDKSTIPQMDLPEFARHEVARAQMDYIHYGSLLRDMHHFMRENSEAEAEISRSIEVAKAKAEVFKLEGYKESLGKMERARGCLHLVKNTKIIGVKPVVRACLLSVVPRVYYRLRKRRLENTGQIC